MVNTASENAELDRPITPHDLRHMPVTEHAQYGFNEEELRARYGWSKGTRMPSIYTQLVATDSSRKELKMAGAELDEDENGDEVFKLVPHECPRCGQRQLPSDAKYCYSCGQALGTNLVEKARKEALSTVRRVLLEDPAALESLAQEVAKVLKRGYTINEGEDEDGVPGLEEL